MLRKFVLPATLIFLQIGLTASLNAQREVKEQEAQQWLQYYGQASLDDHWVLLVDGGFRWTNFFLIESQFLMRAALGYEFGQGPTISAGYAYLGVYRSDVLSGYEHRPYQEIKYSHDLSNFTLSHRLRIEERFFTINDIKSSEVRFRYGINLKMLTIPLSRSKPHFKLDLNMGNELFLTAGNELLPNAFSENRLIFSPNLHINKQISVALTWNRKLSATINESVYNATHIIWLQIRHNIAFY